MNKLRHGIIYNRKKDLLMVYKGKREEEIEGNMSEERLTARVLQKVPNSKMKCPILLRIAI